MTSRRPHRTSDRTAAGTAGTAAAGLGFTLVELLVVVGIVVLLVAIVLPTVGRARVVAQTAKTQSEMVAIAGAIERYYTDHNAYPGVVSNVAITAGYTAPGITVGKLTMTENMVLTLCGGFVYNEDDPAKPKVDVRDIGKGPMNLSASALKRTRRAPYIEASPGNLFPATYNAGDPVTAVLNGPANPLEMPGSPSTKTSDGKPATDSNVPEFVDAYAQPRAILYLRAVVGGAVIRDPPPGGVPPVEYATDQYQYNLHHCTPYRRDPSEDRSDGNFNGDFRYLTNRVDPMEVRHSHEFIRHPTLANTPRGKDKFLLISAGPDRRYCTKDDLMTGG